MNVREEDRQRNSCPSRGLGLAAADIGVGVGAALYCFSNEGPENPDREGSTSGWTCEEPHSVNPLHGLGDDSDTTILEHSSTNTSMNNPTDNAESSEESDSNWETETSDHRVVEQDESSEWENNTQIDNSHMAISSDDSSDTGYLPSPVVRVFSVSSDCDTIHWNVTNSSIDVSTYEGRPLRSPLMSLLNNIVAAVSSRPGIRRQTNPVHGLHDDSYTTISEHSTTDTSLTSSTDTTDTSLTSSTDTTEESEESDSSWETESSESSESQIDSHVSSNDYSSDTWYLPSPVVRVFSVSSDFDTMEWDVTSSSVDVPRCEGRSPRSLLNNFGASVSSRPGKRRQTRKRSWSLEECSICFDIMLKDQQVTTLPCTHNFHSACITPWLQEQQTCPNCREAVE